MDKWGEGEKTGVLLVNLGSPAAPSTKAIRNFLRPFLSDPKVVPMSRWLWLPLLHGVILRKRPAQLVTEYQRIWTAQGSPLQVYSDSLREGVSRWAQQQGLHWRVELAMTYGQASIAEVANRLVQQGVEQLLVLPLFPQYSLSTTAAVGDQLERLSLPCRVHLVKHYYDHPAYINALAASISQHWQQYGQAQRLLVSFHGLPMTMHRQCPQYYQQCQASTRLLAQTLGLDKHDYSLCFQSRVGHKPWLGPYTDTVLADCAKAGLQTLQIVCPGFAADCLETLAEVSHGYGKLFADLSGGGSLTYIPALNDQPDHSAALGTLVQANLAMLRDGRSVIWPPVGSGHP
ncbi:MAG: ferrochelatase [Gammaproteobacteria bacterium]|nr:ferrochelatase [Gammaproteobacteria bacterium]